MEDIQYLNVFEHVELGPSILDFDLSNKFRQPYVHGGNSEFLFLVRFICEHPQIFKPVLERLFEDNTQPFLKTGKMSIKLASKTVTLDSVFPFFVRKKRVHLFTTNNFT
jgi:hypothetical protein